MPTVMIVPAITDGERASAGTTVRFLNRHTDPVDCWNVHLTSRDIRSIVDANCWETLLTHQLLDQRERCGDHG